MKNKLIIWFLLGLAIILVYGLLNPDRFPFPQCPFLSLTGWKCAGCGSQRALYQLLHGHFIAAFNLNMLFIPALGYVLYGTVSRTFFTKHWLKIDTHWYGLNASILILIVIISYWIGRNIV